MEQLWYTWSSVGFGRATGLRVRAASPGLVEVVNSLDRFEPLGLHLGYDLPDEREADVLAPENAATCLAFIRPGRDRREPPGKDAREQAEREAREQQRMLVNKRFSGFDFERRPHPFCHLLTAFPPNFTARDAISLWKSEKLWKYSAEELDVSTLALPALPDDLARQRPGPLTVADVRDVRQELPFVIQAFLLLLGKGQRLSIAAHPDAVARMIWGLTRVVPSGLLKELTFSTYEKDVTKSQALIVGTCWSSTAQRGEPGSLQHLPANWELAINWYTGEPSPQLKAASSSLEADFARFATAALLDNTNQDLLGDLLKRAEKRQIATVEAFLAEYQSAVKGVITKQVIVTTLAHSQLAADDLDLLTFRRKLIDYALEERRQEKKHLLSQLAALRQQADFDQRGLLARRLAALAATAAEESVKALGEQKEPRAWGALEVLATSASPQVAPDVWRDLFTQLTELFLKLTWQGLNPCSPDLYQWLVQKWAKIPTLLDAELMGQWLNFGWEELENAVAAQWPDRWYPLYIHHLIRIPLPPRGAQLVSRRLSLFQTAFQELAQNPKEWDSLVQFIGTFAGEGKKSEKTDLISAMLAARSMDRAHLQQLFQVAHLTADDVETLLGERPQSGAVDAFFDLLCIDKTWREQEGRKVIQRLGKQIEAGQEQGIVRKGAQLASRLVPRGGKSGALVMAIVTQRLTQLATTAIPVVVRQNQASLVSFLQDLLSRLAPASQNAQPWLFLMSELAYEQTLRDQILPWLVKEAARIEHLDEQLIQPWLQPTWSGFIALFKQPLQEAWRRAMLAALLVDENAALPSAVLKLVKEEEAWFIQMLPYLFVNNSQQGVISFFGKLVKQGYSRKQELLIPLLSIQGITIAQVEAFWVAAALNHTEEQHVLEQIAPYLVTRGYLGPYVTDALTRYLPNMTPDNVDQKEALLASVRSHAASPAGEALVQPMDKLLQRALQAVQGAVKQGGEKQALDWIRLLAAATPAEREDIPWEVLLRNLPTPQKLSLLTRLLWQKGLKRRQAEEVWASAALNAAERQQFLTQFAGPLLQHPQMPERVKEFLQDALASPPARTDSPPAEAPQSAPKASAEEASLPVWPAGEATSSVPRGSQGEETVAAYHNDQLSSPAQTPSPNQQVAEPPRQVEGEAKSIWPAQQARPASPPEGIPFNSEFWTRSAGTNPVIPEFVGSPDVNPARLKWVAQAFELMPPGSEKTRKKQEVFLALTTVLQTQAELEASAPILVPALANDQEEVFQWLMVYVKKQARDQEMDEKTLAAKMNPYLQWLLSQETTFKQTLLDDTLKDFRPKTIALIDKHAKNWPPGLYQQWKDYRQQQHGINLESGWRSWLRKHRLAIVLYLTVPLTGGVIVFLILYYLLIIVFKVSLF